MERQLLWQRAVRRSMRQARYDRPLTDFDRACELTAMAIDNLRRHVAGSERVSEHELDRRVSLFRIDCERLERRIAATWRQVVVTK